MPGDHDPYSAAVRRYFANPAHAGVVTAAGRQVHARVAEGGAGARILLTAVTDKDTLTQLRFQVFGCPHLVAACEAVCERFEGKPVEELAAFSTAELAGRLDVPTAKTGRLLLLEDAIKRLNEAAAEPDLEEPEHYDGNFSDNTGR